MTKDNRENPEYHVVAAIRKLRTDTNYPAGKSWSKHVKNEQHIGSEVWKMGSAENALKNGMNHYIFMAKSHNIFGT